MEERQRILEPLGDGITLLPVFENREGTLAFVRGGTYGPLRVGDAEPDWGLIPDLEDALRPLRYQTSPPYVYEAARLENNMAAATLCKDLGHPDIPQRLSRADQQLVNLLEVNPSPGSQFWIRLATIRYNTALRALWVRKGESSLQTAHEAGVAAAEALTTCADEPAAAEAQAFLRPLLANIAARGW